MPSPQIPPKQPSAETASPQFQPNLPVVQQFAEEKQPPRLQDTLLVVANAAGSIANGLIALTVLILIILGTINAL